eukprot:3624888-Rhodomonas_salina.1
MVYQARTALRPPPFYTACASLRTWRSRPATLLWHGPESNARNHSPSTVADSTAAAREKEAGGGRSEGG